MGSISCVTILAVLATAITYTQGVTLTCRLLNYTFTTTDSSPTFVHPENVCQDCTCCVNDCYSCFIRPCPTPECGLGMQQNSSDGCCQECMPICNEANCMTPDCPTSRHAYRDDSCCAECGCLLNDTWPMKVVPTGKFGSCDRCECFANGSYHCESHTCPGKLLECVDPRARKNFNNTSCYYDCPNGYTCRRGNVLLRPDVFVKIGFQYCTCDGDFWNTRGSCLSPRWVPEEIEIARNELCMMDDTYDSLPMMEPTYIDFQHLFY